MTESDYLHEEIADLNTLKKADERFIAALMCELEAKDKVIKLQDEMIKILRKEKTDQIEDLIDKAIEGHQYKDHSDDYDSEDE